MEKLEINLIPKFIDEAASKPARAIGETLTDIWNLGLGNHFNLWNKKQKAKQEINFQKYINEIEEQTQSIPEDSLVEPKIHIVGPALEASKYYIDSEELRNMFAKLIAASIDDRKIDKTHPSFVEIIKQLSPDDAKNISLFKETHHRPIVKFELNFKEKNGYLVLKSNVFSGSYSDIVTGDENAASITNLQRLGLVSISYEENYKDKSNYSIFRNSSFYKHESSIQYPENAKVDIREGIIRLTPLGKAFIEVCL